MRNIRFVGTEEFEEYHSTDPGNDGKTLEMLPGDVRSVSDSKATQLEEDFGDHGLFEFDVDAPAPTAAGDDPLADLDPQTKLKRLKVVQLLQVAKLVDVDEEMLETLGKPGVSRDKVIETIAGMDDLEDVVERPEVAALIAATAT